MKGEGDTQNNLAQALKARDSDDDTTDDTPPDFAFGSGAGESVVEHGTVPPPQDFGNVESLNAVGLESDPAMADGPDFAFGSGAVGNFAQPGPITIPSPDETSASLIDDSDPTPPDWGSGPSNYGLETDAARPGDFEPGDAGVDSVPVPDAAPDDDTADADVLID